MTLFHFGDSPDCVAEDPSTGKASVGVRATLWTSKTGGTQWTSGVTDVLGGGAGGTVISGAFGKWAFTIDDPSDSAATVWLQPEGISGAPGVRWLVRAWESYGPPGPKGDPGDLGGITASDGTVLAYSGGAWAAKSPTTDLGLATGQSVADATAIANSAKAVADAAKATADDASTRAGSGAQIPLGGAAGTALVKTSSTDGAVGWAAITPAGIGAAPVAHTHTANQILNLAAVAVSGDYNDLSSRPAASYSMVAADAKFATQAQLAAVQASIPTYADQAAAEAAITAGDLADGDICVILS